MDGYHHQQGWLPNEYQYANQPQDFANQLHQYAGNAQQPMQFNQPIPNYAYQQQRHPQMNGIPQQTISSRVEVVIPQRPPHVQNFQQPHSYSTYQYNQQVPVQNYQQQQSYQDVPRFDGATDNLPLPSAQAPPQTPLQPVQNGVSRNVTSTQYIKPEPLEAVQAPKINYGQTLLTMAEEYMAAAEGVERDSEEEIRLLSFALGCLESALKNYQLTPLREAQASLVYARLLYERTDNHDEAEKALTKAIEVCERNKFVDLKYSLSLLSVRFLYEIKPKAALKALSGHIREMEAYRHTAWLYIFYYEAAVLQLEHASRDLHHAINQLEKLEELASRHQDKAVVAFAAVMLALVHLQTAHVEAVSSAQQAIAKIRALQFDKDVASLPQLGIMTELLDLCCSIRSCNYSEGDAKRIRVQNLWGEVSESPVWADKGTLFVPVSDGSLRDTAVQKGGLVVKREGHYFLPFTWFTRTDAEALCFLLCTVSKAPKNSSDGFKAEQFCKVGLERVREAEAQDPGRDGRLPLDRRLLECRFYVELTFLCCMKGDWQHATNHLASALKLLKENQNTFPRSIFAACQYLKGAIYQGTGQLKKAMECWEKAILDPGKFLRQPGSDNPNQFGVIRSQDIESEVQRNLSILALINRLFIIDDPSHPQHSSKELLLSQLAAYVKSSPQDRNVTTSTTLAHSLLTNSGIWVSKDRLIKALNEAKAISNQQLTALILALMQQAFFLGATDQHAQQCVKAASVQVRSWRNPTWMHVMDGIWAESLGYLGQLEESQAKDQAARISWEQLPEAVKMAVDWHGAAPRKSVAKK